MKLRIPFSNFLGQISLHIKNILSLMTRIRRAIVSSNGTFPFYHCGNLSSSLCHAKFKYIPYSLWKEKLSCLRFLYQNFYIRHFYKFKTNLLPLLTVKRKISNVNLCSFWDLLSFLLIFHHCNFNILASTLFVFCTFYSMNLNNIVWHRTAK